jgi:hypothetical protein
MLGGAGARLTHPRIEAEIADQPAPDADHRDASQNAVWLRRALDAVLAGEAVAEPETRARGAA